MPAFSLFIWLISLIRRPIRAPTLHTDLAKLALIPVKSLPLIVQECPVALRYLSLLSQLDRSRFSERRDQRFAPLGCRST